MNAPIRGKTASWHVSTRPLRAYGKECNGTTEQMETCGPLTVAPLGFLHLWVRQALPGALARAFASHVAPATRAVARAPPAGRACERPRPIFSPRSTKRSSAFLGRVTALSAPFALLAREAMAAEKPERGRKSNGQ